MPRHKNEVDFDPDTKIKYFRPLHKNQVNFDPGTEVMSSSTQISSQLRTPTRKPSEIRSPTPKPSLFRPTTEIRTIPNSHLSSSQFLSLDTKNKLNFDVNSKTKYFETHKPKSTPIPTLKSIQFRPLTQKQVNFDHPQRNQVNLDAHTKN